MALPARIGGPREKPSMSITVVSAKRPKMPSRIGGPVEEEMDDESEDMGEPISNDRAKQDAADDLITTMQSMKPDRQRIVDAISAIVYACIDERSE